MGRPRKRIKVICLKCHKEFEIKLCAYYKGEGKYCSLECYNLSRIGKRYNSKWKDEDWLRKCSECGDISKVTYIAKKLKNVLCRSCSLKFKLRGFTKFKGDKTFNWKGGISSLWQKIREKPESNEWIKKVFARDNYTCQECGIKGNGYNLNAHHEKPFAIILKEFLQEYSQFSLIKDKETLAELSITYIPFWDIINGKTLCKDCHNKKPRGRKIYEYIG